MGKIDKKRIAVKLIQCARLLQEVPIERIKVYGTDWPARTIAVVSDGKTLEIHIEQESEND